MVMDGSDLEKPWQEGMAERVGFEPTLPFRVNTLSKRAPSATRPSLRVVVEGVLQVSTLILPPENGETPARSPAST